MESQTIEICRTTYKPPEVFVVSSGRSGTTLLSSILNASNQIYFPYESDFIARAYPFYHHKTSLTPADYRSISQLFQISSQPKGWGLSEAYISECLSRHAPQTLTEVISVICDAFHRQEGTEKLLWGIKAPVLIASLERIYDVCPQAKIIHVVRDGRDVCLSYQQVHKNSPVKFGPKSVVENALYWIDGLKRVEDFVAAHSPQEIYELKYENLMADPAATLTELCSYIKIDYQAQMHENFNAHKRNQKSTPDALGNSIHKNLKGKLDISNTQKYLSKMSVFNRMQYELIASPYLKKYGYPLAYPLLGSWLFSPLRQGLYFLARGFNDWRYARRDHTTLKSAIS